MSETSRVSGHNQNLVQLTAGAAIAAGEIWQMPDGRVGRKQGGAAASGDIVQFKTDEVWTIPKTTGIVFLDGGLVYWDHSANLAHFKRVNDRDFYLGRCVGGAASADDEIAVRFNVPPLYDHDLIRDPYTTAIVGTEALGGLGIYQRGGSLHIILNATNEAQKVDALGVDGFAPGAKCIIEGQFRVISKGAGSAPDVSIGIANATHASDADAITESMFIHLNGNDLNIYAESDDGTTEVAATDTTVDYAEGATITQRVEFWFDMRTLTSCVLYIDGVRRLSGSVFNLNAATGPFYLIVHVEKTAATDVHQIVIDKLVARKTQQ